jgi:hypothetical protein
MTIAVGHELTHQLLPASAVESSRCTGCRGCRQELYKREARAARTFAREHALTKVPTCCCCCCSSSLRTRCLLLLLLLLLLLFSRTRCQGAVAPVPGPSSTSSCRLAGWQAGRLAGWPPRPPREQVGVVDMCGRRASRLAQPQLGSPRDCPRAELRCAAALGRAEALATHRVSQVVGQDK